MFQKVFLFVMAVCAFQAFADNYKIDPAHATFLFKVNHLGFSNTYGMFPGVEGSFVVDEAKPANSSVELKIKVDSVNSNNEKRDQHLKSPDFFNSKQNQWITFKSTAVKPSGKNKFKVTGDLTVNGVTKSVTLDLTRNRTGQDPWGATRTGFDGALKLKRSDYNMTYMQGENSVGDNVELTFSVEGIKEK